MSTVVTALPHGSSLQPHVLDPEQVAIALDVRTEEGLTTAEVARRLMVDGHNRLAARPPLPAWRRLVAQLSNVLNLILLVAAVVAGILGDWVDAVVIVVVVAFNAGLGFYQEQCAQRALETLKRMLPLRARVRRGGKVQGCDAVDLVAGDVVLLEAGDHVPADGRVIVACGFEVDEAVLTGESMPVTKNVRALAGQSPTPLAERSNMVWMNTTATRGRAEMVVSATGMRTEIGRLAQLLDETVETVTPLQRQLDLLGRRLAAISGAIVVLIVAAGLLAGRDTAQTFMTAIALAVAAIPEGMPAVVTVALALGMRRMARQNAILRRMVAVETLGCASVICSDKTGTLTRGQMEVRALLLAGRRVDAAGAAVSLDGQDLLQALALCNEAHVRDGSAIGDPTDIALLDLASAHGVYRHDAERQLPRVAEIPFDSDHRYMATIHQSGDVRVVFMKGAPETVLQRCSTWSGAASTPTVLDAAAATRVRDAALEMADEGMRVLAVARGSLEGDDPSAMRDMQLLGLVGLVDPARPEVREALATCREAGITVKMITGDHPRTAQAIARDLGLSCGALSGIQLEDMDDVTLREAVRATTIFARVTPEQKVRVVRALQDNGEVVAMTGDGVNDAPALKRADIGVAMGRQGSEVSKEAADMVLVDDNFASIVGAVSEGRVIYDNIRKFVRFQLSTNMGAIACVAGATALGWPIPLTPIQLLFINVIMDGPPAIALALDPPRPSLMHEPPRPVDESLLSASMLRHLAFLGAIMGAGTLLAWHVAAADGGPAVGTTTAFLTFVMFQIANALSVRDLRHSIFRRGSFSNGRLWAALGLIVVVLAVAILWPPARQVFHMVEVGWAQCLLAVGIASTLIVVEEARKAWMNRASRASTDSPR